MIKLTFLYDKATRIINILLFLFLSVYCFFLEKLQTHLFISILLFILTGAFLVYLILDNFIGRKIYLEGNCLYLSFLNRRKSIQLERVLWYSKNMPSVSNLFCKSRKNICMFYEGKKEILSIKEIDVLESLLKNGKTDCIDVNDTDNNLENKRADKMQYILLETIPIFSIVTTTLARLYDIENCTEKTVVVISGIIVAVLTLIKLTCYISERISYRKQQKK